MEEYFIGAGALLTAGPAASIAAATLHAQTEPVLASQIAAAVVDFEATDVGEISRLLVVAAGWSAGRFQAEVTTRLLDQRECGLGDVIAVLAEATGSREVHIFAHWCPDLATTASLARAGVRLIAHPLEAIGRAALVSGNRLAHWRPPVQAA
ncbi:MAG: hypothetical protein JOZ77_12230 [Candidatus Eremiobacteraeota bacterium]|nr:hypothetical protein [Candidatus Eremiobacteraeota bacterium]